ncbi:hypothetical protein DFJ73DRAFT_837689 [Zopfochytrium polystomum]|nr:hypothetical protein DFJ73DRAFT_837689 [Zopfochytrium polystomum]
MGGASFSTSSLDYPRQNSDGTMSHAFGSIPLRSTHAAGGAFTAPLRSTGLARTTTTESFTASNGDFWQPQSHVSSQACGHRGGRALQQGRLVPAQTRGLSACGRGANELDGSLHIASPRSTSEPKVKARPVTRPRAQITLSISLPDLNEQAIDTIKSLAEHVSANVNIRLAAPKQSTTVSRDCQKKNDLFKTEPCTYTSQGTECPFGDRCHFAHSVKELRIVNRHPKWKTELCKSFTEMGSCRFGSRCGFIHERTNLQAKQHLPLIQQHQQHQSHRGGQPQLTPVTNVSVIKTTPPHAVIHNVLEPNNTTSNHLATTFNLPRTASSARNAYFSDAALQPNYPSQAASILNVPQPRFSRDQPLGVIGHDNGGVSRARPEQTIFSQIRLEQGLQPLPLYRPSHPLGRASPQGHARPHYL